jgi:tetratricopeptide (TPR) repeat protein
MGDPATTQTPCCRAMRQLAGRLLLVTIIFGPIPAQSQYDERVESGNKVVLGVRNPPLKTGAELLLAGKYEEGVEQTHKGLAQALGAREEEAGLANLCAGYLQLEKYDTALQYCDMVLVRNDKNWRAYNNRALIYIKTEQWEKADADLIRGEELNAGASTLKVARSMYMDAVHPVAPEIEIDDRKTNSRDESKVD